MHIGGGDDLRGPAAELSTSSSSTIRSRLHLVPRYRQKLAYPPLESGRPLWVDDPSFNLEYHIRHTALPAPGTEEQLRQLTARIFSQRLDRSKPLWEMWLVEGLEDDRFALITKTHHALSTASPASTSRRCCSTSRPTRRRRPSPSRGSRSPSRRRAELRRGRRRAARCARASTLADAARSTRWRTPSARSRALREAAEGIGEIVWAGLNPAPRDAAERRRSARTAASSACASQLDGLQGRQERASAARVNDVVLAVVAGALRALAALARACAPRASSCARSCRCRCAPRTSTAQLGNRIVVMRGPLPVYIARPGRAPALRREAMDGLKESKQALGAEVIAGAQRLRAADDARAGVAPELLDAPVQPDRHQRARPAVPAVRARARDARGLPGRVPAREPRAGDRDHVLQRRRSTSACSATSTRCPTSTRSATTSPQELATLVALARESVTAPA